MTYAKKELLSTNQYSGKKIEWILFVNPTDPVTRLSFSHKWNLTCASRFDNIKPLELAFTLSFASNYFARPALDPDLWSAWCFKIMKNLNRHSDFVLSCASYFFNQMWWDFKMELLFKDSLLKRSYFAGMITQQIAQTIPNFHLYGSLKMKNHAWLLSSVLVCGTSQDRVFNILLHVE